jgi:uncharacterized protein (TIGR03437 family)
MGAFVTGGAECERGWRVPSLSRKRLGGAQPRTNVALSEDLRAHLPLGLRQTRAEEGRFPLGPNGIRHRDELPHVCDNLLRQIHSIRERPSGLENCMIGMLKHPLYIVPVLMASSAFGQAACGDVQVQLEPDFGLALGSSSSGSAYTFTLGGQALAKGTLAQLLLFHFDGSLASTSGVEPQMAAATSFAPGVWGSAVGLGLGGALAYPAAGNLSLTEGTIEMWIAPEQDGSAPAYSALNTLFQYVSPNGDQLWMAESTGGGFFGSAVIGGTFIAAGTSEGTVSGWKAGEWHHVAFTYSASKGRLRMYLDGVMTGEYDSIELPAAGGATFTVGGDGDTASAFWIDELRISSAELSPSIVQYDASGAGPLLNNETYLSLAGVAAGQLTYSVEGCGTTSLAYNGSLGANISPVMNPNPPSTLLPAGSTSIALAVQSASTTSCGYSVNVQAVYSEMTPFDSGQGGTSHSTIIQGLTPDPSQVNNVYVRCALAPGFALQLQYRAMPTYQTTSFPRIVNINGLNNILGNGIPYVARYDLLTDSSIPGTVLSAIHKANPNTITLYWVNAVEDFTGTLPESYYLHDVNGNRIQDWPSAYLLNITNPAVDEYQANNFYSGLVGSGLMYDGSFFDSFYFGESNSIADYQGVVQEVDSNGDGQQDNQQTLNAAWQAGMLLMMKTWRQLLPNAVAIAHLDQDPTPDLAAVLNGDSLLFLATDVQEGLFSFEGLLQQYNDWWDLRGSSAVAIVESTPQNQIAYGYGAYNDPSLLPKNIPPGVLAFAQSYYPSMRFPLAVSLMNDGYYVRDLGDQSMGYTNWWYDEYNFNLGTPISPQTRIPQPAPTNMLQNGGFEMGLAGWQLIVDNDGQAEANLTADSTVAADGDSSGHIQIVSAGTAAFHVDLQQEDISLTSGTNYQVQFWARANAPRTITVFLQGGPPNYTIYGLSAQIAIGTSWGLYSAPFTAPVTATDGQLEFWVGDVAGDVWLDDVQLTQATAELYRRDFTNGVVLLNGAASPQIVMLETGLQRFNGTQAPLYQYIIDDSSASFTADASWNTVTYDSGFRIDDQPLSKGANPPFYHCWESTCHEQDAGGGPAQWNLGIQEDGQYTIQTWLPAAPNAGSWTKNAIYEIVSGGNVIVSATVDQTTAAAADGWHMIATVNLKAADAPFLRVRNGGSGPLVADAVYVISAALYNDGSPAPQVTLGPFDGILLQRQTPVPVPASRVSSVANAASYQPAITSGGFVSIVGTGFTTSSRSWTSSDFSGNNLPVSLNGVSVTINGVAAYVEYISSTQINVIAPDDDTIGEVPVQVTTPQGASYAGSVLKQKLSPALFTYQLGTTTYVAAVHTDGTLVGPNGPSSRPAVPGEVIEIYGTGFGPTSPAAPTSQLIAQPAPLAVAATVSIGGVSAEVQWSGIVSPGLYQLNVQIPNVGAGDQPVQTSVSGFQGAASTFVAVSGQ